MSDANPGGTFLELRNNFVRVPLSVRKRVPENILKVQPRVLKMLAVKKELKLSMLDAAATSFSLPMPVHISPIIALLKTCGEDEPEWRPKYCAFSNSYAELGQLFSATIGGIFIDITNEENAKLIETALATWKQDGITQNVQLTNDITQIMETPDISELVKMGQFMARMEASSIQILNRYEILLHTCLIGSANIPLNLCLTPMETPSIQNIHPDEVNEFFGLFLQYWTVKVNRTNEKLELDSKVSPEQWITVNGLVDEHTRVAPDQLWRGYMTPQTISEYMKFFTLINEN